MEKRFLILFLFYFQLCWSQCEAPTCILTEVGEDSLNLSVDYNGIKPLWLRITKSNSIVDEFSDASAVLKSRNGDTTNAVSITFAHGDTLNTLVAVQVFVKPPGACCMIYAWDTLTLTGDFTPPSTPSVDLTRVDEDTLNVTNDFHGDATIDSIFCRKKNGSPPTSKTDGDLVYAGTDTLSVNSINFAHNLLSSNTVYVRTFVQDLKPNISSGSDFLVVDEWFLLTPILDLFLVGDGLDSLSSHAVAWDIPSTGFWVLWDDTLISSVADSMDADSLKYYSIADSGSTFKWENTLNGPSEWFYCSIIVTNGVSYYITYDSIQVTGNYATLINVGGTDSLNIKWDSNPPEDTVLAYYLYRSVNDSTAGFALVDSIISPDTSYVDDDGISVPNMYSYYVKARNEAGFSDPSDTVTVAIPSILTNEIFYKYVNGDSTDIYLWDIVSDPDDDYWFLTADESSLINCTIKIGYYDYLRTIPNPLSFKGSASYVLRVEDDEGFWSAESLNIKFRDNP